MKNPGFLILAAGGSSRMGSPKLIKKISGNSLLEHVIQICSAFSNKRQAIVLGGYREVYMPLVEHHHDIKMIINEEWQEGISSSIKSGIIHFENEVKEEVDGVLILLADMVAITEQHIRKILVEAEGSGKGIIASGYGSSLGPPVLFDRKYFPELLDLEGDVGAKSIIYKHLNDLLKIDFPQGVVDIDTPEDLKKLLEKG